ncbi:MAG: hypothetical protein WC924_04270 [Candidatus Gracilibacteria bacterium]
MDITQTKDQKIAVAAQKMARSEAFSEVLKLTSEQWAAFLAKMDEGGVEDCLLLLKEEDEMYRGIEEKCHRRHEANKKRLLSRLTSKDGH